MFKIIVKGTAETKYLHPRELDGIDCQDEFVEYMDDDEIRQKLESGYMKFVFENEKLWTVTEYTSKEKLTEDELNILAEYTQGQWSDGIGEGFEQFPCRIIEGEEIYISPWHSGQKLVTSQEKI